MTGWPPAHVFNVFPAFPAFPVFLFLLEFPCPP